MAASALLAGCASNSTLLPPLTASPAASLPPASTPTQPGLTPSPQPSPVASPTPQPSPTSPPLVTLYNRYVGKDANRQPELIKTPFGPIAPISSAEGYSRSYIEIFLNGKQVNGSDILGDSTALAQLTALFKDAYASGFTSETVLSSYRSYDEQLYLQQTGGDEESSNFLAVPGRSEHHLGTAFDLSWNAERLNFNVMNVYPQARAFYNWLKVNAQRYGFIFSYPFKSNADQTKTNILEPYVTEYKAEPWHIRYVGLELAQRVAAARDPQGRGYLDPLSPLLPQQFLLPIN